MGQKVNPIGMRLGISSDWTACWYASSKDDYAKISEYRYRCKAIYS